MTLLLEPAKTRSRAPRVAPDNIEALLGDPAKGRPRQFIISEKLLRQMLHMATRPPPGIGHNRPPPEGLIEVDVAPLPATPKPRSTPLPAPKWLRPKDVITQYGIRTTLLYKLINEGRVNSKLIDGARVISVASLDALGDEPHQARRRGRPRSDTGTRR